MIEQFAILVTSCDKYSDLWEGFFSQLNANLSLPIKKYLIANHKKYDGSFSNQVETICIGDDVSWSDGLGIALNHIQEEKIFVIVEDFFISKKIDEDFMREVISFSQSQNTQLIHFANLPGSVDSQFPKYLKCDNGMPYLTSVCGIWDRRYMKSLLLNGENAWQFEIYGSYRAQFSGDRIYCLRTPLFEFKNMVQKGAWVKSNVAWARENGVPMSFDHRPIQPSSLFYFKDFYFQLMWRFPWRMRVGLLNLFRKLFVSY
jgi:hypothetical protein